ncbi:MAG: CBS domain-containing protein [Deltaproteobacteria bacterium]
MERLLAWLEQRDWDEGATLIADLVAAAAATRHGVLPVVDGDGALIGVVSHHALREAILSRSDLDAVIVAADLAESVDAHSPRDSLRHALAVMNARGLDALPVVETNGASFRVTGLLGRSDVLRVYEQALSHAIKPRNPPATFSCRRRSSSLSRLSR